LAATDSPEFALAFASKLYTQTKLNPTHNSPQGVGIAQLSKELDDVDQLNPEDALNFAAGRDAAVYAETGDLAQAMAGEIAAQSGPEAAASQMQTIVENQSVVGKALQVGNVVDSEESTFSELDSPENRFRQSTRADDLPGTTNVIDEMIDMRVKNRASRA